MQEIREFLRAVRAKEADGWSRHLSGNRDPHAAVCSPMPAEHPRWLQQGCARLLLRVSGPQASKTAHAARRAEALPADSAAVPQSHPKGWFLCYIVQIVRVWRGWHR